MAVGAAIYFSAAQEPAAWLGPVMLSSGFACGWLVARWGVVGERAWFAAIRAGIVAVCAVIAAMGAGATAGRLRTTNVGAPVLTGEIGPVAVHGWVARVDPSSRGARLKLLVHSIDAEAPALRYVSVATTEALPPLRAVRCFAVLRPPEAPIGPHGFDAARRAFFERVGATGFTLGACRPAPEIGAPDALADRIRLVVAAWRRDLTETIRASGPGEGAAIAAALITGDRSMMSEATANVFRDSGLAHLLSVSGLHMSLAAGMIFAALLWGLALVPRLALFVPIRKIAAAGALAAGAFYLVSSGASVPAQRAYIMTAVAVGAILVDRPAITLRGLAAAAVLILALFPESALDPGFQMSFVATAGLVALFEARRAAAARRPDLPAPGPLIGGLQGGGRLMMDALFANAVAGWSTDVMAAYHFQRIALFALPTNVAVEPIITLIVAPAAAVAAVLAPFGAAEPALDVMAWGLDHVRAIGAVFALDGFGVAALPMMSDVVFVTLMASILWMCLFAGGLRWLGALGLAAGLVGYLIAPKPVLFADHELRTIVMRVDAESGGGWRVLGPPRGGDFARTRLSALAGLGETVAQDLPAPDNCTSSDAPCAWTSPGGRRLIYAPRGRKTEPACPDGQVIFRAGERGDSTCRLVLGNRSAAFGGAGVIETAAGLQLIEARRAGIDRAWARDVQE